MGIGDAITLVGCLAGMMLALPAMMIFLSTTFDQTTWNGAHRLDRGFITPLVVGLVAVGVIGVPASALISLGSIFQLTGVLIILGLLTWAFTGLASLARLIGVRAISSNRNWPPYSQMVLGSFVLTFAIAFPLIGWLIILPVGLLAGLGATILGRFSYRDDEPTPNTPVYTEAPLEAA